MSVVSAASFTPSERDGAALSRKFTEGGKRNSLLLMVGANSD